MLESHSWYVALLGEWGFSGKFIQRQLYLRKGITVSTSTVYQHLKRHGVKLRDYRNGKGSHARKIVRRSLAPSPRLRQARLRLSRLQTTRRKAS